MDLKTMGAEISVCGPATLIPRNIEDLGVRVYHRLEDIIPHVDALNVLRIQLERQERTLSVASRISSLLRCNKGKSGSCF